MSVKLIVIVALTAAFYPLSGQQIKTVYTPDLDKEPTLEWKFKTPKPIFSSPVISEGIVYAGGLDSVLYAVETNSGKLKWKFRTGGEIRSTVCLYQQKVFLFSGDGNLYCIDKLTGKLAWKFATKGNVLGDRRYDFVDYHQSSAVVANGKVFFGAGDSRAYALDVNDGKLIWVYKTDGIIHATPALYNDRVFIGSFDGNIYALDQTNGDLLWKFKTVGHRYFPDGEVQGAPVASDDIVYVGARDYNLYAIDAMEGSARWNKTFPSGWAMAITPRDSVIYVGTSDDRVLVALDAKSGEELWRTDVKFNIFGPCAYSKSMAYVGTLMGKLFGIDLKDGKIKWVYTTEGYAKNRLNYFKPDDSFRDDIMNVIKTPADFIQMEYTLGAIFSTPAITNDLMIVTSTDGAIYCLRK